MSERDDILLYKEKSSSTYADPSRDPFEKVLDDRIVVPLPHSQRQPGPDDPHWKIPPSEWSTVLDRIDQGESLRKIARDYNASYEAIRRVICAARRH